MMSDESLIYARYIGSNIGYFKNLLIIDIDHVYFYAIRDFGAIN